MIIVSPSIDTVAILCILIKAIAYLYITFIWSLSLPNPFTRKTRLAWTKLELQFWENEYRISKHLHSRHSLYSLWSYCLPLYGAYLSPSPLHGRHGELEQSWSSNFEKMSIVSPSIDTGTILCILFEAVAYLYMEPLSPPALYTADTASLNRAGAKILRKWV